MFKVIALKVHSEQVLAMLKGMDVRGKDYTSVFQDFRGRMQGSIEKNFDEEGRPVKWASLAITSLLSWSYGYKKGGAYRTKKGGPTKKGREVLGGRKILTDTALLRRRATTGASVTITPSSFSYAVKDIRAAIHQIGGKAGRGRKVTIPARPFLLFQVDDLAYLQMRLGDYVAGGAK